MPPSITVLHGPPLCTVYPGQLSGLFLRPRGIFSLRGRQERERRSPLFRTATPTEKRKSGKRRNEQTRPKKMDRPVISLPPGRFPLGVAVIGVERRIQSPFSKLLSAWKKKEKKKIIETVPRPVPFPLFFSSSFFLYKEPPRIDRSTYTRVTSCTRWRFGAQKNKIKN